MNYASTGSHHNGPPHELLYALLGRRLDLAPPIVQLARERGYALQSLETAETDDLELLNRRLTAQPVRFTLGRCWQTATPLIDGTSIETVFTPPILLFHPEGLNEAIYERLRQAGVTAVIESNRPARVVAETIARLAHSRFWLRHRLGRVDVARTIHAMASLEHACCLTIACPHVRPLMRRPWASMVPCTGTDACEGWLGRVYLLEGHVLSAETPSARGLAALGELLRVRSGYILQQNTFLWPRTVDVGMSLELALLQAEMSSAHRSLGIPTLLEALSDKRTRPLSLNGPETP